MQKRDNELLHSEKNLPVDSSNKGMYGYSEMTIDVPPHHKEHGKRKDGPVPGCKCGCTIY